MPAKHVAQNDLIKKLKIRLVWEGIAIGLASGLVAVFYRYILHQLDHWRGLIYLADYPGPKLAFLFMLMPLALLVARLLKWAPLSGGSGIPQIKAELLNRVDVKPFRTITSKFIGGSINNFVGLSLGREGPSIQLGGTFAKILAQLLKRDKMETKYMISAGSSAGLAAAFNAPIAGTLFALEELHGSFSHFVLVPCLIASLTANYISFSLLGLEPAFTFKISESIPLNQIHWIIIVGLLSALVGGLFNITLEFVRQMIAEFNISATKILIAVYVLTFLVGHIAYGMLGGGHQLIEEMAIQNYSFVMLISILIGKLLFTTVCFNTGAQGGIFLPVLVLGAATGLVCYKLIATFTNIDALANNFMIIGMAAVLAAVVRAPMMSVILVTEMTGSFSHMLNITIAVITAFVFIESVKIPPVYDTLYQNLMTKISDEMAPESNALIVTTVIAAPDFKHCLVRLSDLTIPGKALILKIHREGVEFIPNKDDQILAGDRLTVLHSSQDTEVIIEYFK